MGVCCSEVQRDKREPDDAGRVHCEPDVLGFVEVFRYFSGFYRIKCTDSDEDHAVNLELILIIRRKTLYNISSECNVFDESFKYVIVMLTI